MIDLEETVGAPPRDAPATPNASDDTLLADAGLDTAHVRNVVQRRLFGAVPEPLRIGRFPILKRLGQGGMGVVYAGFDPELDRKVAIKLLPQSMGGTLENLRERLLREAKALAKLSHPSIVAVYEVGEHEGQIFVAMEHVDGVTLRRWLDADERTTREILDVFAQAGRGLAAAHAAGIVHRDFKPDNAMIGSDGRVRVLDFGLARAGAGDRDEHEPPGAHEPTSLALTRTGAVMGTPAYMAPEQHRGEPADARSDQFAFCVALFEALYDERPFQGETLVELATAVLDGRVGMPRSLRKVAAPLHHAVLRGLRVDSAQRHASMDGLLHAISPPPNRRGAIAAAVVGIAITAGIALAISQRYADEAEALSGEVAEARERVDRAEERSMERGDALTIAQARMMMDRDPTRALALLEHLGATSGAWESEAWSIAVEAASRGIAEAVTPVPPGWEAAAIDPRGRYAVVRDLATVDRFGIFPVGATEVKPLDVVAKRIAAPDTGDVLLIGGERGAMSLWSPHDGRRLATLVDESSEALGSAVFSANGQQVAAARGTFVRVWSTADGSHRDIQQSALSVNAVADDGETIVVPSFGQTVAVGSDGTVLDLGVGSFVAATPDLETLATIESGMLRIWDRMAQRSRTVTVDLEPTSTIGAIGPGMIALADASGAFAFVDVGGAVMSCRGPERVRTLAFSRDGRWLRAAHGRDSVTVWLRDTCRYRELRALAPLAGDGFTDDGAMVLGTQTELRREPIDVLQRVGDDPVLDGGITDRGIVTLGVAGAITLRARGEQGDEILGAHPTAQRIAVNASGSVLATLDHDGNLEARRIGDTGEPIVMGRFPDDTRLEFRLAVARDGRVIASGQSATETRLLRGALGFAESEVGPWKAWTVAPEGDALWTIVPLADGARAELVELASGTVRRSAALPPIPADDQYVACAVSPDGARLALGSQRGTIVVHDVMGSEVRRIEGDWGRVRSLTFAVDGSVVAWSSSDGHVRLAEIRRGWPVDIALGDLHDAPPELRGGTWDLSLHDRLLAIDDSALFYVGNDAVAYTWTLDVPRDPAALRAWVAAHTPIAVDPEDLGWITSAR